MVETLKEIEDKLSKFKATNVYILKTVVIKLGQYGTVQVQMKNDKIERIYVDGKEKDAIMKYLELDKKEKGDK